MLGIQNTPSAIAPTHPAKRRRKAGRNHCAENPRLPRFPFPFNSTLLTLPLSLRGFDFPSIPRINDAAAVAGIQRDLNHHIPVFRDMARITLTDWTCLINHCCSPFDGSIDRTFVRQKANLPWAWILAQQVMRSLGLSFRHTDQSHIMRGDVAIAHLVRNSPHLPDSPRAASNLSHAGFHFLNQLGTWETDSLQNVWRLRLTRKIEEMLPSSSAALRDWPNVKIWLHSLSLSDTVRGDWTLAIPRGTRRAFAEQVLSPLIDASTVSPLPFTQPLTASDGSCVPGMPRLHDRLSVTFSVVSNRRAAVFSLSGRASGILQAEVYGLVTASLEARQTGSGDIPMYTDHLNSTRIIGDSFSNPLPSHAWSTLPARSLYRWLRLIIQSQPTNRRPKITYTRAHTDSQSIPARANAAADALASQSHNLIVPPLVCPDPTFCMDEYTFYTDNDGYIESNISSYIHHFSARSVATDTGFLVSGSLFPTLYDVHTPPEHPYIRASSSYSTVVQLYARSSQLPTAVTMFRRSFNVLPWCSAGCEVLEMSNAHPSLQCVQPTVSFWSTIYTSFWNQRSVRYLTRLRKPSPEPRKNCSRTTQFGREGCADIISGLYRQPCRSCHYAKNQPSLKHGS
ncbi:hypothetical protein B0H13DRAFT_2339128 [Mycena leptocephala]|nr:hypothetical protein B0H13DRAFT_2339128 [Mycena leptocephala]